PAVRQDFVEHHTTGIRDGCRASGAGAGPTAAICPRTSRQRDPPRLAQSRRQWARALPPPSVPAIPPWTAGGMEGGLRRELDVGVKRHEAASPHPESLQSKRLEG